MSISLWLFSQVIKRSELPNDTQLPKAPLGTQSFQNGLNVVFGVAGGAALVLVTYGGIRYALSQGNPQETNRAKDIILNALIGLAIIITAYGIIAFVARFL